MKQFIQRVALDAGAILRKKYRETKEVSRKDARELITSADIASESFIKEKIRRQYPSHSILAEESPKEINKSQEYLWIVDPLDGTNNFAHSLPFFSVSIAVMYRGEIILGVVYEPLRDELFYADETGTYLNTKQVKVSNNTQLSKAMLATGFPYDLSETNENNLDHFSNFSSLSLGIRRMGSAALDLAYVSCGRFDGFWELKLKPWDMAAGYLLVKKAGGIATNFEGKNWSIEDDRIIAANPTLHQRMYEVITGRK